MTISDTDAKADVRCTCGHAVSEHSNIGQHPCNRWDEAGVACPCTAYRDAEAFPAKGGSRADSPLLGYDGGPKWKADGPRVTIVHSGEVFAVTQAQTAGAQWKRAEYIARVLNDYDHDAEPADTPGGGETALTGPLAKQREALIEALPDGCFCPQCTAVLDFCDALPALAAELQQEALDAGAASVRPVLESIEQVALSMEESEGREELLEIVAKALHREEAEGGTEAH